MCKKIIVSIIVFISFSTNAACFDFIKKLPVKQEVPRKKMLYGKYTELEICNCVDSCFCRNNNSDILVFVKGYPIFIPIIKTEWKKEVEYFEPRDTLARQTLVVYEKEYVIDALVELQSQYTGAYNLSYAFLIHHKKQKYIVLLFYDGYQMGTEQQGMYIIFKLDKNNATFYASYIENLNYPLSKIKIVTKKDSVYLKSKNLDRCL